MSTEESIKDIIFSGFLALQKMKDVPVNVKHRMLTNLMAMNKDSWKVVGITQAALKKFVDNDSYNWVRNNLTYYASRNITFSNHFHIAVKNLDEAVHITNNLRKWTAPLLALSANSPFFDGIHTRFRSSRTMNFGNFPRTHIPSKINSSDDFLFSHSSSIS